MKHAQLAGNPDFAAAEFSPDLEAIELGARVLAIRQERQWTLLDASEHTGLSLSAVSKIERGILSPTLSTLNKLAAGFGIDVVTLLRSPLDSQQQGRRSLTPRGTGAAHFTATCHNFWLAAEMSRKRMLPIYSTVTARLASDHDGWSKHEGEIFVYVISGTLIVHSENYNPARLEAGDSIYYDASSGHNWTSDGPEDAEILWVFSGQ
jgi:transcriptional regulator with XRE-family HTH domain